jgi:tetratricopeptide (TPR) repeat protein
MTSPNLAPTLDKLLSEGNAALAAEAASAGIAEVSQEPRVILRILAALDKQRKDSELNAFLAKLDEQGILRQESLLYSLRLKFREGEYTSALRLANEILRQSENHVEALRVGGRIGNLKRDDNLALPFWERLARAVPTDAEAALQAARIRLRQREYPEALEWARRVADVGPASSEAAQIAVRAGIAVGWPEVCDRLLIVLYARDREAGLRAVSEIATSFDATVVARVLAVLLRRFVRDLSLREIADKACSRWLVAALEHELASRELDASGFYFALRRVRPDDAEAKRALERLVLPSLVAMRESLHARDFAGTIEHGQVASRIDPECLEAWQSVGRAHFSQGAVANAQACFRRCTELAPEDARIWLTYGLMMKQAGDRAEALAALQNARRFARDAEVKREVEASIAALHPVLVQDAQLAMSEDRIEVAWACYTAAAAIRPPEGTDPLRRDLLRLSRQKIQELWAVKSDAAIPLCRRYLQYAPEDQYVAKVLARTLMGLRNYSEALPIWENLAALDPLDPQYHLQVARCCRSLKLLDRGIGAAEEAYRLDLGLREAAEIAESLRQAARQTATLAPWQRVE